MHNIIDVSIIVVNWNTKEYLNDCLISIFRETQTITFEVIVVDNGSVDQSAEMVRELFPQVKLIANDDNKGFPRANNQGIAISSGRYVLLLNSDTVILDGAIQKLVGFADSHPEAGAVGGTMLGKNRKIDPLCFRKRFDAVTAWQEYLFLHKRGGKVDVQKLDKREVDVLVGAYMMVRSEVIKEIGGLDELFFLSAEDLDWCLRIRKAGWKIYYYPESVIIHYGSTSFKRSWDRGIITGYHSKELLFHKHYGIRSLLLLRGAAVIGSLIRWAGWANRALWGTAEIKNDAQIRRKAYWQVVKQALRIQSFETSRHNMESSRPHA